MSRQELRTRLEGVRGKKWALTFDEFVAITSRPCTYCGVAWSREYGQRTDGRSFNGTYRYNGIDRIDSAKGYIIWNCAPCCKHCNFAKNDMPVDAFKAHVAKIYRHFVAGDRAERTA